MKAYSTCTGRCYLDLIRRLEGRLGARATRPGGELWFTMPPVERIITHHSCATVSRPAAEVSRYVLDPTTMPHWSAVIYDVDPPTAGVFEKGGRLRGRMHILGLSLAVEGEVVEV